MFAQLKKWAPFRIDALGLVTILGAEEVDRSIGRLVQSYLTDCLPLLGAYTIASNQVTEPIPGFVLYNITDSIMATDLTGWFTRWLLCVPLSFTSTTITISISSKSRHSERRAIAYLIGFLAISPLIFFAAAMRDWWGLVNALSMAVSVFVRKIILWQNRRRLDLVLSERKAASDEIVKVFLTTPTGKAVSIYAPRLIVTDCLLTTPRPPEPRLYNIIRTVGWVAFGAHVISLGMTVLFNQILSVCILLAATVLVVQQVGDRQDRVGSYLSFNISVAGGNEFRAAAFARLRLSENEENSMIQWNLFPHRSNEHWWMKYHQALADKEGSQLRHWNAILTQPNFT